MCLILQTLGLIAIVAGVYLADILKTTVPPEDINTAIVGSVESMNLFIGPFFIKNDFLHNVEGFYEKDLCQQLGILDNSSTCIWIHSAIRPANLVASILIISSLLQVIITIISFILML